MSFESEEPEIYKAIMGDRLSARSNGAWAEAKLYFLEEYAKVALDATARKRSRYYVDLFAGPGAYRELGTARFRYGSAIRAMQLRGAGTGAMFTHFVFVNLDPDDHSTLQDRIARCRASGEIAVPPDRILAIHADATAVVPWILSQMHQKAYGLFYADIENPSQWPWSSVEQIRAKGHESLDYLMLFPLHMGINRMIPRTAPIDAACSGVLDAFFGTPEWRSIVAARSEQRDRIAMRAALTNLYLQQLRTKWRFARHVAHIRKKLRQDLYQLHFASDHPAGDKIAEWASGRPLSGQTDLFSR